jgi:hypothetical protein
VKKLRHWLKEIFNPQEFNDIDVAGVAQAFNDPSVRSLWIAGCLDEIKRINISLDQCLLTLGTKAIPDLCARRKAIQDVLEMALSARRQLASESRPNLSVAAINLDRVTV